MSPSVTSGWENFFVAEAGASAALAGLLFVAVSLNLTRILAFSQLPGRAAESLVVILSVLLNATWGLVPAQPVEALAAEFFVTGLLVVVFSSAVQWQSRRHRHPESHAIFRVATNQIPGMAYVVGGALLASGVRTGIYWVVPGTVLSLAGGVFNTWVLLVEIQR